MLDIADAPVRTIMRNNPINERNDLQEIIDRALKEMTQEKGGVLGSKVSLAEFCRKTGLSRGKARRIQKDGFKVKPHGRCGQKSKQTVMSGHEHVADDLLKSGVTNSAVIYDRLVADGYTGGITTVKSYIRAHKSLVPAKRKIVAPQTSRGIRYTTAPGEAYQMDWGFINLEDNTGKQARLACFACVCHHCGDAFIEFFTNARQENLFIGMIHAFIVLGVPEYVLTDNMKSVVVRRDFEGNAVWQVDYAAFMSDIGFKTKLCKPRHPFTKGKVERLVRFVKDNFVAGRKFSDLSTLNEEALEWCARQSASYRRALACVPEKEHANRCRKFTKTLEMMDTVQAYLCPKRKISFDGFVSFEGRRYGVPYWYQGSVCRINREGSLVHIYDVDLTQEIAVHLASRDKLFLAK
jgi:transposase